MPTKFEDSPLHSDPAVPCLLPLLTPTLGRRSSTIILHRNGFFRHMVRPTGNLNRNLCFMLVDMPSEKMCSSSRMYSLNLAPFQPPNFLDLCVQVPRKGQHIGPSTSQRKSVDVVNRETPCGVAQDTGGGFQGRTNMLIRDIKLDPFLVICQQGEFGVTGLGPKFDITATQCPDGAHNWFTIGLLVNAYPTPPILLVVTFEGGGVGRHEKVWCSLPPSWRSIPL